MNDAALTTELRRLLGELRRLCVQYDQEHGTYPESECEGRAVFAHIVEKLLPDANASDIVGDWPVEDFL